MSWQMLPDERTGQLVSTGYPRLDSFLAGGFHPGEPIVIGSEPQTGKSALALNLAVNAAAAGRRVLFASSERSLREYARRVLALMAQVPSEDVVRGDASEDGRAGARVRGGAGSGARRAARWCP